MRSVPDQLRRLVLGPHRRRLAAGIPVVDGVVHPMHRTARAGDLLEASYRIQRIERILWRGANQIALSADLERAVVERAEPAGAGAGHPDPESRQERKALQQDFCAFSSRVGRDVLPHAWLATAVR